MKIMTNVLGPYLFADPYSCNNTLFAIICHDLASIVTLTANQCNHTNTCTKWLMYIYWRITPSFPFASAGATGHFTHLHSEWPLCWQLLQPFPFTSKYFASWDTNSCSNFYHCWTYKTSGRIQGNNSVFITLPIVNTL